MGVMECDRKGCENIMCSHYNSLHGGYMCYECLEELKNITPFSMSIGEFFKTPKQSPPSEKSKAAWAAFVVDEFN